LINRSTDPVQRVRTVLASMGCAKGFGCAALVAVMLASYPSPWSNGVHTKSELLRARSANDPAMRKRIERLSPSVSADEAARVAACAFTTGRDMAREWRVFWMAGVQNFLVNTGARKGGLCFQWATELLYRLEALKLQTLDLHWAESYPGTASEHNVIVVTAKGQPFEKGILLDNWRYEGRLMYGPITGDPEYKWKENPAELVRRLKAKPTLPSQPGESAEQPRPTP